MSNLNPNQNKRKKTIQSRAQWNEMIKIVEKNQWNKMMILWIDK